MILLRAAKETGRRGELHLKICFIFSTQFCQ